jgi:hypothetical protein
MLKVHRGSSAAWALLAFFAALALFGLADRQSTTAEEKQQTTAFILVGSHCFEVSSSCLSIMPTSMAFPGEVAPALVTAAPILRRLEPPDLEAPAGAAVLIPTPPPRSA